MAHGWKRWLFVGLGLFFVGLGAVGAVLPGLPTTPFVLLASYFFARSSPRLHRWLRRSPLLGHFLRDWESHRAIRRPAKYTALAIIVLVCGSSVFFAPLPTSVRIVIAVFGLIGLGVVSSLPVVNQIEIAAPADLDGTPPRTTSETVPSSPTSTS